MKAILTSCGMEARISFIRDFMLIFLSCLILFLEHFTDFPFQPQPVEKLDSFSMLAAVLFTCCVYLAIFCRTVFRNLEDREYYSQHPINYQQHFIGKCLYIFLVVVFISLLDFLIPLSRNIYYSSSLVAYSFSELLNTFSAAIPTSFFVTGLILFVALFRPFHYLLLIAIISTIFYSAQTWPSIKYLLPDFGLESPKLTPFWIYAPILWFLGMKVFQYKMTLAPQQKKILLIKKLAWLERSYAFKWIPMVASIILIFVVFQMANSQIETESSPFEAARTEIMQSVYQIKNQTNLESSYFSFNFQKQNQWIFDELSAYSDSEWELLHKEFSIPFARQADSEGTYKIDIFIKTSQKHQLGSTRGSFIIINAETINSSANPQETLKKTFRHELAHVLINQLSQYQFINRTDILNGFFHEGLATLVEHHWNSSDESLINEAALNFNAFDLPLFELLPKISFFDHYDYRLNYTLGYVFWGEFVKYYGQQQVKEFLSQLGTYDDEAYQFDGMSFLFHKSNLVNIDLYKIFHATRVILESAVAKLNQQHVKETETLKNVIVARINQNELLIPYQFNQPENIHCMFRKKTSMQMVARPLKEKNFSGRTGGLCNIPQKASDELQIHIRFDNGINFYSPWIDVPEL